MERMTQYVLYHANCHDGFGAAWAAHKYFGEAATYIPVAHGSPPPQMLSGANVLMFDFSYDRDTMLDLNEKFDLFVCDHHKTAEAALEGLSFASFDMDRSGAMLAWDYFFPGKTPPDLLTWIQDRDLWNWDYPESRAATAALVAYPLDFEVWDKLMEDPSELLAAGKVALALGELQVAKLCDNAYIGSVGGHDVPVVNATSHWSDLGNRLCQDYPEHPFSASWYIRSDGSKKWSLRSIGEFDVSEIASQFGGGGHRNAAGFVTP